MKFLEDLCRRLVTAFEAEHGLSLSVAVALPPTPTANSNNSASAPSTTTNTPNPPAPAAAANTSLVSIARAAYEAHLAMHHTWLIRQAVRLALHTLPYREQLVRSLLDAHRQSAASHSQRAHEHEQHAETQQLQDGVAEQQAASDQELPQTEQMSDEEYFFRQMLLVCDHLAQVFDRVQSFYQQHDLLNLP